MIARGQRKSRPRLLFGNNGVCEESTFPLSASSLPVPCPGRFTPPAVRSGFVIRLPSERVCRPCAALTVLELMTVIVIISILMVMAAPSFSYFQARAQKAKCIGNLKSLHVAMNSYVQDNHRWPQIATAKTADPVAAQGWIDALKPYGLSQLNWVCPTIQQVLRSPDLTDPTKTRVDYYATPFNAKATAPFQQPKQPWFIEAADVHGNGQEIIFPDGHVEEASDILQAAKGSKTKSPGANASN